MLKVDGIKIDLAFEDEQILYIPLRKPTTKELEGLTIHWLIPRTPDSTSRSCWRGNTRWPLFRNRPDGMNGLAIVLKP